MMRVNFPAAVVLWLHFSSSGTVFPPHERAISTLPPPLYAAPSSHDSRVARLPTPNHSPSPPPLVVIRLASHSRQQIPSPAEPLLSTPFPLIPPPPQPLTTIYNIAHTYTECPTPLLLATRLTLSTCSSLSWYTLVNHPRHPEHREVHWCSLVDHIDGKIFFHQLPVQPSQFTIGYIKAECLKIGR